MEDFGYTQEKLAQIVGKSRSHLANTMRLLTLPQPVLDMITDGQVTGGQMRPLIGRDDAVSLARSVAARGMSARQVEAMVARLTSLHQNHLPLTPILPKLKRNWPKSTVLILPSASTAKKAVARSPLPARRSNSLMP